MNHTKDSSEDIQLFGSLLGQLLGIPPSRLHWYVQLYVCWPPFVVVDNVVVVVATPPSVVVSCYAKDVTAKQLEKLFTTC